MRYVYIVHTAEGSTDRVFSSADRAAAYLRTHHGVLRQNMDFSARDLRQGRVLFAKGGAYAVKMEVQ